MPQNALVGLIYEAVNDPLLWDAFLNKFTEAVHSETAGLLTQDKAGQSARVLATVGMDSAARKSYEEYFVSRNPWLPRRTVSAGTVETGERLDILLHLHPSLTAAQSVHFGRNWALWVSRAAFTDRCSDPSAHRGSGGYLRPALSWRDGNHSPSQTWVDAGGDPPCRRPIQGPERGSICETSRDQHQNSTLACATDLRKDRGEAAG